MRKIEVEVHGEVCWKGFFQRLWTTEPIAEGFYAYQAEREGIIEDFAWYKGYKACEVVSGWVVIDSLQYEDENTVSALELRFEQYCRGRSFPLNGALRWLKSDHSVPPSDLWQPPSAIQALPAPYLYLESQEGDLVGQGRNYTSTSQIRFLAWDREDMRVWNKGWFGYFKADSSVDVKLYTSFQSKRSLYKSFSDSELSWSYNGSICKTASWWCSVDAVERDGEGELREVRMRFEQHCNGTTAALHGALYWVDN